MILSFAYRVRDLIACRNIPTDPMQNLDMPLMMTRGTLARRTLMSPHLQQVRRASGLSSASSQVRMASSSLKQNEKVSIEGREMSKERKRKLGGARGWGMENTIKANFTGQTKMINSFTASRTTPLYILPCYYLLSSWVCDWRDRPLRRRM